MSPVRPWAVVKPAVPYRMIFASFAAGVGAMVFIGLIAPTIAMGGLSMRSAAASTLEQHAPLIQPLDVHAIHAKLDAAQTSLDVARRATDPVVVRLEQLSHD